MRVFLFILFLACHTVFAQKSKKKQLLFDNPAILEMVDRGGDYIYNEQFDKAMLVIDSIEKKLPGHPIVYMMTAMNYAWQDQPIHSNSPQYAKHLEFLDKTLVATEKLKNGDENNLEAMFFEMSVHGLMAEYYAGDGSYMKAISRAQQTYTLIKATMEKTGENPEFYFLAGLYNYFREKYPERHPVYRPFLWFFKSGNIQRGLIQLDSAANHTKIIKIEAHLYLAYIYLRYENNPDKALVYLKRLHETYPANSYFKAKYLECVFLKRKFDIALPIIQQLVDHKKPYFQLAGLTYQAIYFEKELKSNAQAEKYYKLALDQSKLSPYRGFYYRALANLGMGRVLLAKGDHTAAVQYLQATIDMEEHPDLTAEAKKLLAKIPNY